MVRFIIRTETTTRVREQRCPTAGGSPVWYFKKCIERAVRGNGVVSIELLRVDSRREYVLESWTNDSSTGLSVSDQISVKYPFKIHGFETANDPIRSANTLKWYESEEAAIEAATGMVKKPGNKEAIVIYKAIKIVTVAEQPVTVETLDI